MGFIVLVGKIIICNIIGLFWKMESIVLTEIGDGRYRISFWSSFTEPIWVGENLGVVIRLKVRSDGGRETDLLPEQKISTLLSRRRRETREAFGRDLERVQCKTTMNHWLDVMSSKVRLLRGWSQCRDFLSGGIHLGGEIEAMWGCPFCCLIQNIDKWFSRVGCGGVWLQKAISATTKL